MSTNNINLIDGERMKAFEFDANKYNIGSTHQKEWGKKIIAELSIKGDESILDLGCGDGVLTKEMADLVPNGRVVGIDASENMISKAKELSRNNLEFIHRDINDISFNEEFDIVYSNATLHWIKDHVKLLANCYRTLKSSGILRFNFAGDGNCATFNSTVKNVMQQSEFKGYFAKFLWPWFMPKTSDYEQIIRNNNFTEIKIWEENADRYFISAEEMIKWIDQPSLVPFLREIVEQDKSKFRDVVVNEMIQKSKKPDGKCFEMFRRINVRAKK